ncbi:MAG: hypothetical protein ACI8PZ_000796 [Myxococcota bacterium]|jgi:hypothetical protein
MDRVAGGVGLETHHECVSVEGLSHAPSRCRAAVDGVHQDLPGSAEPSGSLATQERDQESPDLIVAQNQPTGGEFIEQREPGVLDQIDREVAVPPRESSRERQQA